jgi:hypothetical protein
MLPPSLKNISTSFEKTLINSDLQDVTVELAEISLDSLLKEGILKEVPILSTIIAFSKTALNVQDHLFLKKIIHFISEIKTIPLKDRQKMIDEIDKSHKYKIKVGEKLLYIIDKTEDHKSAEIIAKMFVGFLKGKMDYNNFLKGAAIINNISYDDLETFVNSPKKSDYLVEDVGDLLNSGLYNIIMEPLNIRVGDQDDWKSNEKFKTDVYGGTLKALISPVGDILRETLTGQL